ncbi:MAG: endonuclease domain-containing protein [Oscillospiraceae bacterium]|nr:endonuclease domain-containing protein [Oscillospiraceae bacterium]
MYYDHKNVENARKLRKEMTPWERKLWYCFLKTYPVRFQRQKVIDHYIVDFYCAKAGLVLELDGGGHYHPESEEKDKIRTEQLQKRGLKVIRFCNLDIDKNFYGVCTVIEEEVKRRTLPNLASLCEGGGMAKP